MRNLKHEILKRLNILHKEVQIRFEKSIGSISPNSELFTHNEGHTILKGKKIMKQKVLAKLCDCGVQKLALQ